MNCSQCGVPALYGPHKLNGGYCKACAYLTIPETYAALRLSRSTYYRLVKAGKINPRQISPGRVLVPRADVDAILGGQ